jgi:hypothetical protein
VAGIEIENTTDADVYENTATNNTGGLLVFDLPGLPVKNGRRVRVHKNHVFANNHANFAAAGNKVANVAPGTGMMVLATDQVEVFLNKIEDNQTFNLAVVSYHIVGRPQDLAKNPEYDPVPEGVYIHDNTFAGGGDRPSGKHGAFIKSLVGSKIPDIIYDGVVNPARLVDGRLPEPLRLYVKGNGSATFANLQLGLLPDLSKASELQKGMAILGHQTKVDRNPELFAGELPPLPPVTLPNIR